MSGAGRYNARMTEPTDDRRSGNRRKGMIRNIFSYLNRRDLFKKGRRKNEAGYDESEDWFDKEQNRST
jgi:hypothetical protein